MMVPATALLAAAALAVCADQGSKLLMLRLLPEGAMHPGGRRSGLTHVLNVRGGLVAVPLGWAVLIWIAALAIAALVSLEASRSLGVGGAVGLGLALGGATGNLADRAFRGAVLDFIAVGGWPTFNLADAALVAGTVLLVGSLA